MPHHMSTRPPRSTGHPLPGICAAGTVHAVRKATSTPLQRLSTISVRLPWSAVARPSAPRSRRPMRNQKTTHAQKVSQNSTMGTGSAASEKWTISLLLSVPERPVAMDAREPWRPRGGRCLLSAPGWAMRRRDHPSMAPACGVPATWLVTVALRVQRQSSSRRALMPCAGERVRPPAGLTRSTWRSWRCRRMERLR